MVFLCLQLKNYKLLNVTARFWNKEIAFSKYTTSPKFNFKNMCSAFKNISKNPVCISCIKIKNILFGVCQGALTKPPIYQYKQTLKLSKSTCVVYIELPTSVWKPFEIHYVSEYVILYEVLTYLADVTIFGYFFRMCCGIYICPTGSLAPLIN